MTSSVTTCYWWEVPSLAVRRGLVLKMNSPEEAEQEVCLIENNTSWKESKRYVLAEEPRVVGSMTGDGIATDDVS